MANERLVVAAEVSAEVSEPEEIFEATRKGCHAFVGTVGERKVAGMSELVELG